MLNFSLQHLDKISGKAAGMWNSLALLNFREFITFEYFEKILMFVLLLFGAVVL